MKVCRGLHLYPVTCCRIFPATKYRLFRVDQTPDQNGTASAPATQVLFETQTWMTTGMGGRVLRTAGKALGPGGSPRFDPEHEPGQSSLGSTSSSWGAFQAQDRRLPYPQGPMDLYQGLAEGRIPVPEALLASANTCRKYGTDPHTPALQALRTGGYANVRTDFSRSHWRVFAAATNRSEERR